MRQIGDCGLPVKLNTMCIASTDRFLCSKGYRIKKNINIKIKVKKEFFDSSETCKFNIIIFLQSCIVS